MTDEIRAWHTGKFQILSKNRYISTLARSDPLHEMFWIKQNRFSGINGTIFIYRKNSFALEISSDLLWKLYLMPSSLLDCSLAKAIIVLYHRFIMCSEYKNRNNPVIIMWSITIRLYHNTNSFSRCLYLQLVSQCCAQFTKKKKNEKEKNRRSSECNGFDYQQITSPLEFKSKLTFDRVQPQTRAHWLVLCLYPEWMCF